MVRFVALPPAFTSGGGASGLPGSDGFGTPGSGVGVGIGDGSGAGGCGSGDGSGGTGSGVGVGTDSRGIEPFGSVTAPSIPALSLHIDSSFHLDPDSSAG